jgi:hypothetical protein
MTSQFTAAPTNLQKIENEDVQLLAEKFHTVWNDAFASAELGFQKTKFVYLISHAN